MVGGGIFTVLGISVAMIGAVTPFAIIMGGFIALLAAYSYVKLGKYYKDEGASFSFYKKTFPTSHFAPSILGWFVIFGLYKHTFALCIYFLVICNIGYDFRWERVDKKRNGVGGSRCFYRGKPLECERNGQTGRPYGIYKARYFTGDIICAYEIWKR